jgi:hypothetical protein
MVAGELGVRYGELVIELATEIRGVENCPSRGGC